jgi:hypothetical protein
MALYQFTASTDLTGAGKGRRVASWHCSQGAGTQTINFRNGSITGPIMFQVQLPATTSASQSYTQGGLPTFPAGLYVEVVGTGFGVGSVDLV